MGHLSSLRVLVASGNSIATLPDALGDCASLEELDLSHNKVIQGAVRACMA